jgi:hypothetical protein
MPPVSALSLRPLPTGGSPCRGKGTGKSWSATKDATAIAKSV